MQSFFADYLERLTAVHRDCREAISELPPEALNWQPGPEMNSIAVLVTHMAGAERYWIGDVAAGETSDRLRAEEFQAEGSDAAALGRMLDDSLDYVRRTVETFSLDEMPKSRPSRVHNREFTAGWSLLHALEHSAQHSGHIQLTRQLWDNRTDLFT